MLIKRAHFALLLPLALLSATLARATTIRPLSLEELVTRADQVVLARVSSQSSRWVGERTAIVTATSLEIEQVLKGPARAGERIEVQSEGGVVEGIGMRVQGAAQFKAGEEVLLFLERRGGSTWTLGMAQGKLRVQSVAGRRMVTRDLAGLAFVGDGALDPALPLERARPLDELVEHISSIVRAGTSR